MKSQDLDLLQKQHKEKGIPPCWCQQRSSEELKGLSLPLPSPPCQTPATCTETRSAQPRRSQSQRGTRPPNIPSAASTNTCPPQRAAGRWKLRALLLGFGGGHGSASRDSSAHFSPHIHNHFCLTSFNLASNNLHPSRESTPSWDVLPTQPG